MTLPSAGLFMLQHQSARQDLLSGEKQPDSYGLTNYFLIVFEFQSTEGCFMFGTIILPKSQCLRHDGP